MSIGNGAPAWPSVIVSNGGISPSDHIGGAVEIGLIRRRNDRSKMNDYARRRMNIRESTTDTKGRAGCMPFPIGKT